jgi:oxygen-independent coproporphyrinogen-3 oxidase
MPEPVSTSLDRSLYVHVPFCAHKCEYCAFYSHLPSGEMVERYLAAVREEAVRRSEGMRPKTIFFGGGTPSLLTLGQWQGLLERLAKLDLLGAAEWTVECNPATISLEKAKLLRSFGVNRISMGVQSLDEALLERLGRIHTRSMVFKSFDLLRKAGFENLNLDLMFAIPGQTLALWQKTLTETLALDSEHLSSYEVIYEEDTPLFAQLQAGQFDVDEDLACDMYDLLVDLSGEHGFHQYEIANFARGPLIPSTQLPARVCRHNVNYWRGGDFLGLGPSATSYLAGIRMKNWSNTTLYCERIENGHLAVESREQLMPLARAGETAAFGLRMTSGWSFKEFTERTGFDLLEKWPSEMDALVHEGMAVADEVGFRLTRRGLRFADAAAERFIRLPGEREAVPGVRQAEASDSERQRSRIRA